MKKIYLLFLILIFIISFIVRFYQLDQNPPGMHIDEAEAAYAAYSILQTGHDHYGNFLPLQFQDNNRMPLAIYSLIPFVKILGLNTFAERVPFALLGVLTVVVFYFFVQKLFKNKKISIISTLLLALNPWSIQLSRIGLEESLCLFLVLFGITLIFYVDKKKLYLLPISGLILGLSLFSYHASKIFLTLFLPVLFYFKKDLFKISKKYLFLFLIVFGFFYIFAWEMTFFGGISKMTDKLIFNSTKATNVVNSERHLSNAPLWLSSIFHNKPNYYLKVFTTTYVGLFSVNYLFLNGESNLDKGVSNHGQFYLFELPFFFLGLYYLFKKDKKIFTFLFLWILFSAVPGGLTSMGYYAYRDLLLIPIPIIFSSVGMVYFYEVFIKKIKKIRILSIATFIAMCLIFILSYLFTYFYDYPVYSSDWWQLPQKKALEYVHENKEKYDKVYISGGRDWQIFYAFYNKIDPVLFQNSFNNRFTITNTETMQFENLYFGGFPSDEKQYVALSKTGKKILYVGFKESLTENTPVKVIRSPDEVNIVVYFFESDNLNYVEK